MSEQTHERVRELLLSGRSGRETAAILGVSPSAVSYHARRLSLPSRDLSYDWGAIREHYESGATARDCLVAFGLTRGAWKRAVERGDILLRQRVPSPAAAKRGWNREHMRRRRDEAVRYLGGRCVRCASTADLEFDHVDPATKSYTITANLNRRWEILVEELDKCQLLCKRCHRRKTTENRETGGGHNRWTEIKHGTAHAYLRYRCRCDVCRAAQRDRRRMGRLRARSSADRER